MTVKSFSYGGGTQSNAVMVLMARGEVEPRPLIFANVGEDSESWRTLLYIWDWAAPYAAAHGLGLLEVERRPTRGIYKGRTETLMGRLTREGSRSLPIPVRMDNGAPGTRSCTADFKIRTVGKLLKAWGASKADPAYVALGISTDEIQRAKPGLDPDAPYQIREYPLLDLGISRRDCGRIIAEAGLPQPPKSACFFCPFHDTEAWRRLKREDEWFFERSADLEDMLNERRTVLGKDRVWLTRAARPLRDVFADDQLVLDLGTGDCESGWCMT